MKISLTRPSSALVTAIALSLLAACGSDSDEDSGTASPTLSTVGPTQTASVCARSIPPLTNDPVTRERLEAAVQKMTEVQQAAAAGDDAAARAAFSGDAHGITHDIDQPLRAADPLLAQDLCASIVIIEEQFNGPGDLQAVSIAAGVATELLQDSSDALGLAE